jgi:hypothetical protein
MPKFKHGTARNQFRAAMSRSAERRQCPKCNRKSALVRLPRDLDRGYASMTYCRWADCDYERHGE